MCQTLVPLGEGLDAQAGFVVNEGVMCGVSESEILQQEKAIRFQGVVRLENNGGFASMRKQVDRVSIFIEDVNVHLRVRGDGQQYECRMRMNGSRLSYVYAFATKAGEITSLKLPIKDFRPSFRGRSFDVSEVGYLDLGRLQEFGILIADKQKGEFQLDLFEAFLQ